MSYDLSPKVIEPRRVAFDNLVKRYGSREATRYEEGTVDVQQQDNFHYRPLWNPTVEIFDPSMTALKLDDWYSFLDPRSYYYAIYNQTRNKAMDVIDGELSYANERGLLEKMNSEWRQVLLAYLLPLRHYEYGGNILLAYVGRFAYGTSIEQCASFNTFDKMANSQLITKLCLMLPNPEQLLEETKQRWLEAAHLQPLRELVEQSWLIQDWAEVIVVQNLLTDVLLYGLLYDEFDKVALDNGMVAATFVHKYLTDWLKDNLRWTTTLVETFLNDAKSGEANKAIIQGWLDRWTPKVVEAVQPFQKVFEMPQRPGNYEDAFERAFQNLKNKLERLDLAVSAEPLAVGAAD